MKKINVLFVSVLALGMTLASCSTDDSPSSTSGSVEGKWIYNKTAYTYLGVVNPEENYAGNELGCFKDYI